MLKFVIWACYAYAAVWILAAIAFYCINRALAKEGEKPSVLGNLFLGLCWPCVLCMAVYMLWLGFCGKGDAETDAALGIVGEPRR